VTVTRRSLLKVAGALTAVTCPIGSFALAIEPGMMLDVTRYALTPPRWPANLPLEIAVIADIHACEPYMPAARVKRVCDVANALKPDLTVILGDFNGGHNFATAPVLPSQWGEAISGLRAPLGVYAILGNHDWWHGALPRIRANNVAEISQALKDAGVALMENDAIKLTHLGQPFWLVGLGDQLAYRVGHRRYRGADDVDLALSRVTDDAPVILLAHEPYVFHRVPDRVSLTLCGHTHGGQVDLPIIGSPVAARRFGANHVYGHAVEDGRHMIISAGLGTSSFPVRFGRPPEVVMISLGSPST
jgi:predicted MPP superfamily phosphohydrolase